MSTTGRFPCQNCGTYHDTAACPQIPFLDRAEEQRLEARQGRVTFNGTTLGEQQILDKLDKIIELLGETP